MRIDSLIVENLLSFDEFELKLEGQSHTIVGPNGSGKSNCARIFDLVIRALEWAANSRTHGQREDPVLTAFASAHHHGQSQDRQALVRLEFTLTTPLERSRMAIFLRAAILSTLTEELWQGQPERRLALNRWVDTQITEDKLQPLFKGIVVLRHIGLPHLPWEISYEFVHNATTYTWELINGINGYGTILTSSANSGAREYPPVQLRESMFHMEAFHGEHFEIPDPIPDFNLASICPSGNNVITPLIVRIGSGSYEQSLNVFRQAIEALGFPTEGSGQAKDFFLAYVLANLIGDGIFSLREQFRGIGFETPQNQSVELGQWGALVSPQNNRTPGMLASRLFYLKNGSLSQRAKYQAIQEVFSELASGRSFEVRVSTMESEIRKVPISDPGQTNLSSSESSTSDRQLSDLVMIVILRSRDSDSHPQDLPIQFHGAGVWEALLISEALIEAEGRFVILDEPALTLHPNWQRTIRSRIKDSKGQFLVITHSAGLVPLQTTGDLLGIVRFDNESGATRAHRFPPGLSREEAARIVKEFSLSADARSLLFAKAVVLLEGDTELGTFPRWFEDCEYAQPNRRPTDLDIAFHSVDGDKNFRTLIRVLDSLSIPWVLICDGAAFDLRNRSISNHIFGQVTESGQPVHELNEYLKPYFEGKLDRNMDLQILQEEKSLGEKYGIFTLADGWKVKDRNGSAENNESFEVFLEKVAPGQLSQAESEIGSSKVRKGLWIAETVACPGEVNDLYKKIISLFSARKLKVGVPEN